MPKMTQSATSNSTTMRLSRRRFLKASALASGATLLAACAAPPAAPAADKPAEAAPTTAPAAGEKSLTVWAHRSFAPPADDVLIANINRWAEQNGVKLDLVAEIEVPTMNERTVAAIESGNLPDVSAISGGRVALHYPANVYTDLSDLYKEMSDKYGGFFRPAEQTATIDGKQWVLPYSIDTSLMYYRQDILDEKGQKIPETWEEYVTVLKAAQTPPDIYGAGIPLNKQATDGESTFGMMMHSFGAHFVAEDGKTLTVNTPEMKQFLEFVTGPFYESGILPPGVFEWDNAGNNKAYQEETVISIDNPASVLVWALDNKPELAKVTTIKSLPAGPKGQFASAGTRVAWAVFNKSPEDKQAMGRDLLRYLMEPAQFEPWIAKAFAAPAVKQYESMDIWKDPQRAGFLEGAKNGIMTGYPGPITPAASELDSRVPVVSMILRVLVDKFSVDDAIAEAEKVANDVYSKYQ